MNLNIAKIIGMLLLAFPCFSHAFSGSAVGDYSIVKIWDEAPHNAFTDIVEFKGKYYCAFREAVGHVPLKDGSGDGNIRIIVSNDGITWKSAALLTKKGFDLRDAKLSVTPDGRLMVVIGGSIYEKGVFTERIPQVSFSNKKGDNFSNPQLTEIDPGIRSNMDWLWRITWYGKTGYGVVYRHDEEKEWSVHLVKTSDGIKYQSVAKLDVTGKPNEATVEVSNSGEMHILMRREGGDRNGWWGTAGPPYTDWAWSDLGIRLGGPNVITLPDGRTIIGTRSYEENNVYYMSLYELDKQNKPKLLLHLPSGGDTSYPGFLVKGDELWVSYYSSHEGKSSVYLAKIPFKNL